MTAHNDKTKKLIIVACTLGVFAFLMISMTGGIAADKASEDAQLANASVEFVNPDTGVILIAVDKAWKISGIDSGDQIEIVVEEETEAMKEQRPRRWRMRRYPYGGPSDK